MLTIRNCFGSLAIIGGLIGSLNFIQAAGTIKPVQSVSADDMNVMLQAVEATTPVAAELVPQCGTFYSAFYSAQFPNWPPLPGNINNVPAWNLGDGVWLLDDLDQPQAQMQAMAGTRMTMDVPSPGDGGDSGTNSYTFDASSFVLPDYGTNLWIAQVGIVSGNLVGVMTNSLAGTPYEIQSCENLLGGWGSEGAPVYGSETANWTPFSVAMNNRTNLFLRIRSWADSTGSGIPDWWWLQYFGSVGGDPFAFDSAGDGWTIYQKFQMGLNPNVYYSPPAPQGVTVLNNMAANQATIQWLPSPGPVTGYTVEKTDANASTVQDFNVGTNSYQDDISGDSPDPYNDGNYDVSYRVQAHYSSGGVSAWSASVPLQQATLSGSIVPGTNGATYLLISGLPETAAAVRLVYYDYIATEFYNDSSFNTYRDISVSAFTNGATLLPSSWEWSGVDAYGYTNTPNEVESIDTNGNASAASWLSPVEWSQPFYDGRVQMKQNLIFLLRAASESNPFNFTEYDTYDFYASSWWWWNWIAQEYGYGYNFTYPGNYAWVSPFRDNGDQHFSYYADEPFDDNYRYRNFVFNTAFIDDNGFLTTGVFSEPMGLINPVYEFVSTRTNIWLATNQTRWLFSQWESDSCLLYGTGTNTPGTDTSITTDDEMTFMMASNASNIYGLPYLSALFYYINNDTGLETATLYAGQSITRINSTWFILPVVYVETAQPQFQTVEYDFWEPAYSAAYVQPYQDLIPGMAGFSPTNTSRLMIMPVGASPQIAGYAKLAVLNGYPGVYAYLGQYFDRSYTEDTNGVATTNSTGFLTPYGSFFPTQPGPAALVTMPDVDTGARGTCTVYCVSAQVDKNNDGNMDLSFNGPDATSQASPYRVWVNSGHCEPGKNGNLDKDLPVPPNSTNYSLGEITCQRDLENFFRLWVCGLPALPASQGYTVTLSMSPSSGNPAINLYDSVETNGGTGYLTDTNIAAQQCLAYAHGTSPYNVYYTGPGAPIAKITPSSSFTFPASYFTNSGNKYFLFEGACTNGSGELLLTIFQNGNTIAQTGVWLDLHDVKDFYERAKITNNISGAISNWMSAVETVLPAISSALGDDQDLIALVHGINVSDEDWWIESDTVFKRLYWAGFHGKFATVKWPCNPINYLTFATLDIDDFNDSEIKAYKAGAAMKTYVDQLHARFPGYRLHLFVHSQGNAVVSTAIQQGATFDTYILTQGALPASCYDINAPTNSTLVGRESYFRTPEWQPMGYHGVYTNLPGNFVNFFNSQDAVLNYWYYAQEFFKPSIGYAYNGTNSSFTGAFSSYTVTDPQESRSEVSRSRTLSIGAQGLAPGETKQGIMSSTIDLHAQFGFDGSTTDEHSAQWTRPIQNSFLYYKQILIQILPAP
jgi:hypothetical protein